MDSELVWQDRFNIGVESIDKEHKTLFSVMHRLIKLSEQGEKSQWVCQEGIKYFKAHAIKHFNDEETYMQSIGYGGYAVHKRLHDNFRKKTLPALEEELEETEYSEDAVRHFLGVCIGWLTGHTIIEDQAIVGKGINRWTYLPGENEMYTIQQTIIRLMYEIFRLDTRVISEHYNGGDFGKALCCRLIYRSEKNAKWEIMLVFEEKLILSTVGEMLNIKFLEVNDVVVNAVRYITRQFMEGVRECFPSLEAYDVAEESLMSGEQFQKAIQSGVRSQCSMLFDTGKGYFVFHVVAPEKALEETGQLVGIKDATGAIKAYLEKNRAVPKKKILVVDDSSVIRLSMKKLLEKDYWITEASSGVATIKSLALEKPDLILLDYEMPVCDGKKTLEMIRAEEEMADIPVIFLTGRGDKESIINVMSLRPAGYLLKSLKPEEIKKNIDEFFAKKK